MVDWQEAFQRELGDLRRLRDELRVQLHLAGKDAQEGFAAVEHQWEQLEARARVVGESAGESLDDIGEAARLLLDEVKAGYRRVRELL